MWVRTMALWRHGSLRGRTFMSGNSSIGVKGVTQGSILMVHYSSRVAARTSRAKPRCTYPCRMSLKDAVPGADGHARGAASSQSVRVWGLVRYNEVVRAPHPLSIQSGQRAN